MKIGFRVETKKWRVVLAIDPDHFYWRPGEIESGSASPGEYFDCMSDRHWLWGWLGITVFYGEVVT